MIHPILELRFIATEMRSGELGQSNPLIGGKSAVCAQKGQCRPKLNLKICEYLFGVLRAIRLEKRRRLIQPPGSKGQM